MNILKNHQQWKESFGDVHKFIYKRAKALLLLSCTLIKEKQSFLEIWQEEQGI